MTISAAVITVSDRSSKGERPDTSGPIAVAALREAGYECADPVIIPDGAENVQAELRRQRAAGARVIVTTGGTGVSPRDRTPEGTVPLLDYEIPGIAEELRRQGRESTPMSMVSRGRAGVAGEALIVNLPGSRGAVRDGMPVILSVARHVVEQISGGDH